MARSAQDLEFPHPLVGQVAILRAGVKPAGWDEDEPFDELPYADTRRGTIKDVAVAEEGHPFGTVELAGWWWDLRDFILE